MRHLPAKGVARSQLAAKALVTPTRSTTASQWVRSCSPSGGDLPQAPARTSWGNRCPTRNRPALWSGHATSGPERAFSSTNLRARAVSEPANHDVRKRLWAPRRAGLRVAANIATLATAMGRGGPGGPYLRESQPACHCRGQLGARLRPLVCIEGIRRRRSNASSPNSRRRRHVFVIMATLTGQD